MRPRTGIGPTLRFAAIWQRSKSVAEVAERTGYPRKTASVYAVRLRRLGIELKKFPTGFLDSESARKIGRMGRKHLSSERARAMQRLSGLSKAVERMVCA